MKEWLKTHQQEHKSAFILALVIGIIFILPHTLMPILSGNDYSPLVVKGVDARTVDEVLYAQYLREVMDGHFIAASNVYEQKQVQTFSHIGAPFPSFVLGMIAKLIGIEYTYYLSLFMFTALSSLLIYALAYKLTQNRIVALMTPGLLFFSPTYMIKFFTDNITQPISYFSRFYPVLFDFPVLAAALLMLLIAIEKKSWICAMITGIIGGLLFYTYFYYWTFYGVFLIIIFMTHIKNRKTAMMIAASAIITLLIGLPFLIAFLQGSSTQDIITRHITDAGRTINIPITLLLIGTLIALTMTKRLREEKQDNSFINALIISSIIIMNIQLIVGFTVSPRHWLTTTIWPILILAGAYIIHQLLTKFWRDEFYSAIKGVIVIFLIFGAVWQSTYAFTMAPAYTLSESHQELFQWLNKNTQNDDVVAALNSELILLVPVYTHNNNYIPNAITESTSLKENIERRLHVYKILNTAPDQFVFLEDACAIKTLWKNEFENVKGAQYRYDLFEPALSHLLTFHIASEVIADECQVKANVKESVISLYNTLPRAPKYRMDYVIVSSVEKDVLNADIKNIGTVVFENEQFKVIKTN